MASSNIHRHIEIKDGDQTVAAADVTATPHGGGTVRASLHPASGHVAPSSRARLVDAVMDLPEVRASTRLNATVPLGDAECLERLRQRTEETVTRPAGSTALVDADIPAQANRDTDQPTAGAPPVSRAHSLPSGRSNPTSSPD